MQSTIFQGMSATSPRNIRRRENFRRIVESFGGVNEVSRAIKSPASHVSAILAGNAGVGDKLAQKIERTYELKEGALDADPNAVSPIIEIDQLSQVLSRMVTAKRISQEEVAGMLQTLLAREKLSPP